MRLRTLINKSDLAAFEARMEATLKGEVVEVKRDLQDLSIRITNQETTLSALEVRVVALEAQNALLLESQECLLLLQDDLENRNRRNNIKLRGIPESTAGSDLQSAVVGFFNTFLNKPPYTNLELDRVHTVGAARPNSEAPRDVVCRVHLNHTKAKIITQAWRKDPINSEGAEITILSDLSRRTLLMRSPQTTFRSAEGPGSLIHLGLPTGAESS